MWLLFSLLEDGCPLSQEQQKQCAVPGYSLRVPVVAVFSSWRWLSPATGAAGAMCYTWVSSKSFCGCCFLFLKMAVLCHRSNVLYLGILSEFLWLLFSLLEDGCPLPQEQCAVPGYPLWVPVVAVFSSWRWLSLATGEAGAMCCTWVSCKSSCGCCFFFLKMAVPCHRSSMSNVQYLGIL